MVKHYLHHTFSSCIAYALSRLFIPTTPLEQHVITHTITHTVVSMYYIIYYDNLYQYTIQHARVRDKHVDDVSLHTQIHTYIHTYIGTANLLYVTLVFRLALNYKNIDPNGQKSLEINLQKKTSISLTSTLQPYLVL